MSGEKSGIFGGKSVLVETVRHPDLPLEMSWDIIQKRF
jgi:hypothetical protein